VTGAPERIVLTAVPLSPIHIGDGTELLPDCYRLAEPRPAYDDEEDEAPPATEAQPCLEVFAPSEVLAAMSPVRQKEFRDLLDRGHLQRAYEVLRGAVGDRHVRERIGISGASLAEIRESLLPKAARRGAIVPFTRSGGRVIIPGSSIKGALRTALLSHLAAGPAVRAEVERWPVQDQHRVLNRSALDLSRDDTADDPFRFLRVADVAVPAERTIIDRASVLDPRREGKADGIQMHYERLLSTADGFRSAEVALSVTIEVDGTGLKARRARDPAAAPRRDMSWAELRRAANDFHWRIWQDERKRFFADKIESMKRLDILLAQIPKPDGTKVAQTGFSENSQYMLLRIGRFGHFESKSVAGLRRGYVPQRRSGDKHRQPDEMGATRTVVRINDAVVPFGWLLLYPRPNA
jgi:CRISPR-associated protein Csm5